MLSSGCAAYVAATAHPASANAHPQPACCLPMTIRRPCVPRARTCLAALGHTKPLHVAVAQAQLGQRVPALHTWQERATDL